MRAPDAAFAEPRLASLYDALDGDRSDLDAYLAVAAEVGAASVADVGCGTGSLAVRLAAAGLTVVGVDPATASMDIARAKPHAELVTWVDGDATDLVRLGVVVDLVVMTANVAQVFVSDEDWDDTLAAVHACLPPGGWFVFETRRPEVRDWERWEVPPTTVDGVDLPSVSTLRFRERAEVEADLVRHGFEVVDVRDAPDRPGKELVFHARRGGAS